MDRGERRLPARDQASDQLWRQGNGDRQGLSRAFGKLPPVLEKHGPPIIQEHIPGRQRANFPVLLDRNGELKFAFHKKIVRNFRVTARLATVEESVLPIRMS